MKVVLKFTMLVAGFCSGNMALAGELVTLDNGRSLYAEFSDAGPGKPVVVLMNGLTDSTENWEDFAALVADEASVLRYDMTGQGRTVAERTPVDYTIPLVAQVEDLDQLLEKLGANDRALILVGLSYGGGVAIAYAAENPEKTAAVVAMAPYTRPVKSQDEWIRNQILVARVTNPFYWALFSDDEMYDYFLRVLVYSTYGVEEPGLLADYPNRMEAALQMVIGIRKFDARSVAHLLPAGSLHLVVAGDDEYIQRDELDHFWNSVPVHARASRVNVLKAKHRLHRTAEKFVSGWLRLIIRKDSRLHEGLEWSGDQESGVATSTGNQLRVWE